MCKWGTYEKMEIDGRIKHIDKCIAPLIKIMREYGIDTVNSCCGHGKQPLSILVNYKGQIIEIGGTE